MTTIETLAEIALLKKACHILAGIVADSVRIKPDNFYDRDDLDRQESWYQWGLQKAEEELE